MKPVARIAGVILAAGASIRMGHPKAMLRFDDGETLLARQHSLLSKAGCRDIIAVVGCSAPDIRAGNMDLEVHWVVNDDWQRGQFSSLQAGLSAAGELEADRALVLPVDVVGVRAATIEAVVETSLINPHADAVVPQFEGRGGHPVCVSMEFIETILRKDPADSNSRLDLVLKEAKSVIHLPVNDRQVSRNVNTRQEWDALHQATASTKITPVFS